MDEVRVPQEILGYQHCEDMERRELSELRDNIWDSFLIDLVP